jgi:hypothetical protein
VAEKNKKNININFDVNVGTFDALNTEHLSFYKSDYLAARKSLSLATCQKEEQLLPRGQLRSLPREAFHLHQLFRGVQGLHVLRAPDPSLRVRYHRVECLEDWPTEVEF